MIVRMVKQPGIADPANTKHVQVGNFGEAAVKHLFLRKEVGSLLSNAKQPGRATFPRCFLFSSGGLCLPTHHTG